MLEGLRVAESIVANKFTALLIAVVALWLATKHLIANVRYRREGMEARIKFLEEQVLLSSEIELECISISSGAVSLLATVGSGAMRRAADDQIRSHAERAERLRKLISDRHEILRQRMNGRSATREQG